MAKIVYADWDERLSAAIRDFLVASGHECVTLTQGTPVCDTLRETEADLAIIEVMMPDVCGFEICRRIRLDGRMRYIPVIMRSPYGIRRAKKYRQV